MNMHKCFFLYLFYVCKNKLFNVLKILKILMVIFGKGTIPNFCLKKICLIFIIYFIMYKENKNNIYKILKNKNV